MDQENNLRVNFLKEQNCRIIKITGEITYLGSSTLQEKLESVLDDLDTAVIIDFQEVPHTSSAGLRVLLKFAKDTAKKNKPLVLFGLNSLVSSIFKVAGFDQIFNIQADKEKALSAALT